MNCTRRKRLQLSRVVFLLSGVFLCTLYQLTISARLYEPFPLPQIGEDFGEGSTEGVEEATVETGGLEEPVTATHELEPTDQTTPEMHVVNHTDTTLDFKASTTTESPLLPTTKRTSVHCIYVAPEPPPEIPTPAPAPAPAPPTTPITPASPGEAPHMKGEYPEDIFSIEERRRGWVVLHIIGMMYMFVSLAIVCDEFFVPALGVITDKLAISDDVAGATFMAAGGSAPELFTSLIGVFIAHSNTNGDDEDNTPSVPEDDNRLKLKPSLQRGGSSASLHNSTMRNTIFQLMIHTLDPLGEGKFMDKAETLNNVARRKAESKTQDKSEDGGGETGETKEPEAAPAAEAEKKEEPEDKKEDVPAGEDESGASEDSNSDEEDSNDDSDDSSEDEDDEDEEEEEEEKEEPLSLQWPDKRRKQATYLFLLPIVFPLWLTVPDVRNQKYKKFFAATFLGSILWIAVFSYLMVWWAHQVGETIGISEEIMGLTILAAGTSIPDLITSVIVARKGLGDMAVSSSVGSNIFDITVGLPVPWLLYSSMHNLAPVAVSSNGLFCAIVLLFLMLLFVIISIATCKWKMNKGLGSTMFLLYFIFLVLSVMLEDRLIICPVSI
ncbi:sodium/potassium/calcium exchanger 1 isoform X2 [Brachyistius frenatus]|uniref:sodium/potassium/calcium exchanger 1 isoform X2 n=1 Tax=Brachyistius frenatus TaxID=100188 RepID=UPI0037E7CF16